MLKKYYFIDEITGDGNCLFYSLSNLIFNNMYYYAHIRQIICDYYETTDIINHLFETEEEKNNYITKMKKDKVYGTGLEIETFCNIFKLKIILYTRHINEKDCLKKDDDKVESVILGNAYEGNFALVLDKYSKEILNHFSSLKPKSDKNKLNNDRLNDIKNMIINKYPNIKIDQIISGKTGKKVGERKGKSEWNLYEPLSRKNKDKGSFDYYIVKKRNCDNNKNTEKYANYADLVEGINLEEIIDEFKAENIKLNGVGNIIMNYKNIIINKIITKGKDRELKSDNLLKVLNLNDELAKEFTNCICYNCSGFNNEGKKLYKIVRSLYELKNHCRDLHNKELNNCIINYTLAENHVEIEHGNKLRYIINLNDMYKKDKENILQQIKGGNNSINNYFNIKKIKIIGENILTLNR